MTHQDDLMDEQNDLPETEAGASEASEDALDAASEGAAEEASEGFAEETSDAEDAAGEDAAGEVNDAEDAEGEDVADEASHADSLSEDVAEEAPDAEPPSEDSAGENGDADPASEDAADAQSDAETFESASDDAGDAEQAASEDTADAESSTGEEPEKAADTASVTEPPDDTTDKADETEQAASEDAADTESNADEASDAAADTASEAKPHEDAVDTKPEADKPAPPQPPSDEPVIYGLDGEKPEETRARTSRKKTWMIAGGLAAAALLAGAFMLSAQTASNPQPTSTQSVEVEVAEDEEAPAKPTRLSAERIMQMLKDLNYDHSNIGLSNDVVWLEIAEGHIDVVQVVDNDCGISPWALTDLTVERAAALADQMANSRIKGEGDQKPFNITDLSWQVVDQNGDAYMAVTFDPGFDQVGTTKELLRQARGYIFSDGLYFALGAETVGYEQQGGTSPTNPWGATIVPTAYLASYGDGQDEAADEVEAEEEAETEE